MALHAETGKPPQASEARDGTVQRGVYRQAMEAWRPPEPDGLPPPRPARPRGAQQSASAEWAGHDPQAPAPTTGSGMKVVDNPRAATHLLIGGAGARPPALPAGPPATTPNTCNCRDHNASAHVGGGDGNSATADRAAENDALDEHSSMWVGGNALLPIPIEQRVIVETAESLPKGMVPAHGGMLIKQAILGAARKYNPDATEEQIDAGGSDTRVACVVWVRGHLSEGACARCKGRDENYPRRQCSFLKGGTGEQAAADWKLGVQRAPYRKFPLCAWCTGGGTPQQEAEEPFLVFDVLEKTYRPPNLQELEWGLEKTERLLQEHWHGKVAKWEYMPNYYGFGVFKPYQPATAKVDAGLQHTPSPQRAPPVRSATTPRRPPPTPLPEKDTEAEEEEEPAEWPDHGGAAGGDDDPSDGSDGDDGDDDDPRKGGGGPPDRDPEEKHNRRRNREYFLNLEKELSADSKQLKEEMFQRRAVREALEKKSVGEDMNPPVKTGEDVISIIETKVSKEGKARLVVQVYRALKLVEDQYDRQLAYLHKVEEIRELRENPDGQYSGWVLAQTFMEALLGGENTALGRMWAFHTAEWRRRIWVRKVQVATGVSSYVSRYSLVEAVQKWLVDQLHRRENQQREAKDALLERAEALRMFQAERTATAVLEQLLEIHDALKALGYGITLTRTQIAGIIWAGLSPYIKNRMDEYRKANQEKKKNKSPDAVDWMHPMDKLSPKVKVEALREMVRLADEFRTTTRTTTRQPSNRQALAPAPTTPKRTRGGTAYPIHHFNEKAYVMLEDGYLHPCEETLGEAKEGTAAAAWSEEYYEEDEAPGPGEDDHAHGSLKAAPVGHLGPNRRPTQQHRNGRLNASPRAQPGPQRIQTGGGTMFAVQQINSRPIYCYNCGKEGHKRFECPEATRTREQQGVIMQKLQQLRPQAGQQPHAALIVDMELACAARSADFSHPDHAQQVADELGYDAALAVTDFLRYLGDAAPA